MAIAARSYGGSRIQRIILEQVEIDPGTTYNYDHELIKGDLVKTAQRQLGRSHRLLHQSFQRQIDLGKGLQGYTSF